MQAHVCLRPRTCLRITSFDAPHVCRDMLALLAEWAANFCGSDMWRHLVEAALAFTDDPVPMHQLASARGRMLRHMCRAWGLDDGGRDGGEGMSHVRLAGFLGAEVGGGGGAELNEDERFLLQCWRHASAPTAPFWGGKGDAGGAPSNDGQAGDGGGKRRGSKQKKKVKRYMRDRMPFGAGKRKAALEDASESEGMRKLILSIVRRAGVGGVLSQHVSTCVCSRCVCLCFCMRPSANVCHCGDDVGASMSVHRTRVKIDRTCAGDGGVAVGARQLLALALCTARTRTSLAGNAALCHGLRAPVARRNNFPGRPAVVSLLASVPDGGARSALHLACAVLTATDVAMCHAHELQTVGRPEGLRVGAGGGGVLALRLAAAEGAVEVARRVVARCLFATTLVNAVLADDPAVHVAARRIASVHRTRVQTAATGPAMMLLEGSVAAPGAGAGDGRYVSCLGLALACGELGVAGVVLEAGADKGHGWGTEHHITLATAAHVLFTSAPLLRPPSTPDVGGGEEAGGGEDSQDMWVQIAGELSCSAETKLELKGPALPDVVSLALSRGYFAAAVATLSRADVYTMLQHGAALCAAIHNACVEFVRVFCDKGFLAYVTAADMPAVYAGLLRGRGVAGGVASCQMLQTMADAHARDSRASRHGFGPSWPGLLRVAAGLGHADVLALALTHVAVSQSPGQGPSQVQRDGGSLDGEGGAEEDEGGVLLSLCGSGRVEALAALLPVGGRGGNGAGSRKQEERSVIPVARRPVKDADVGGVSAFEAVFLTRRQWRQHSLPAVAVAVVACPESAVLFLLDMWTPDVQLALAKVYCEQGSKDVHATVKNWGGRDGRAAWVRDMFDWEWQGMGCMHVACARGLEHVIDRLLAMGLSLDQEDAHGVRARDYLALAPACVVRQAYYWDTPPAERRPFVPFLSALAQGWGRREEAGHEADSTVTVAPSDLDVAEGSGVPVGKGRSGGPAGGAGEGEEGVAWARVGWSLAWKVLHLEFVQGRRVAAPVAYGASVLAGVFGVGAPEDFRRAAWFSAAAGEVEAWRALMPVAARVLWEARGAGSMDRHLARLCWPALWVAAARGHEKMALEIVDVLKRCRGFRVPLPLVPAAPAGDGGEEPVVDWASEWDVLESEAPAVWMAGAGRGHVPSAVEGLVEAACARGLQELVS